MAPAVVSLFPRWQDEMLFWLTVSCSVWKTVDAPRYLIGYTWTIALDVCMLVMLFVLRAFWNREKTNLKA